MAIRRRRSILIKRWLFTYPSHLKWWYSKNLQKFPEQKHLITGVINSYYEFGNKTNGVPNDSEKHHNKWKDFAESMGWDYMPCVRFSHAKKFKSRAWLFNPKVHEKMVQKANKWCSIALDMEPYGLGWKGYHRQPEAIKLDIACKPWNNCTVPVAIYPSLFTAPEIILSNCICNEKIVLDHTTYNVQKFNNLRKALLDRHHYFFTTKLFDRFMVGLFLVYLKDKKILSTIGNIFRSGKIQLDAWFFPRAKDDRVHLFTPNWNPIK